MGPGHWYEHMVILISSPSSVTLSRRTPPLIISVSAVLPVMADNNVTESIHLLRYMGTIIPPSQVGESAKAGTERLDSFIPYKNSKTTDHLRICIYVHSVGSRSFEGTLRARHVDASFPRLIGDWPR